MKQMIVRRAARWSAVPLLGLALAGCDTMGLANSVLNTVAGEAANGVDMDGVKIGADGVPVGVVPPAIPRSTGNAAADNVINSVRSNTRTK